MEAAGDGAWRERAQQLARDLELLHEDSRALRRALGDAAVDLAFQQECQACVLLHGPRLGTRLTMDWLLQGDGGQAGRGAPAPPARGPCSLSLSLCSRRPPAAQANARASSCGRPTAPRRSSWRRPSARRGSPTRRYHDPTSPLRWLRRWC